jgi:hypothetical protein
LKLRAAACHCFYEKGATRRRLSMHLAEAATRPRRWPYRTLLAVAAGLVAFAACVG